LRSEYNSLTPGTNGAVKTGKNARNDSGLEARQPAAGVSLRNAVRDDISGRTEQDRHEAKAAIDQGRSQISDAASTLSERYRATLRAGKVRPNHGGNQAVWDTVGANASAPELGTAPEPDRKTTR
jgi:hypothetical protein